MRFHALVLAICVWEVSWADDSVKPTPVERGILTDPRDWHVYPTVRIGRQTWMAANLDWAAPGALCYDHQARNCESFGRLYDWNLARVACPKGWHLPTDAQWSELEETVGGRDEAGVVLKARHSWSFSGCGTDDYGFSVLPGGYCTEDGACVYRGEDADFWTATPSAHYDSLGAWHRGFGYGGHDADRDVYYRSTAFSVRCLQD